MVTNIYTSIAHAHLMMIPPHERGSANQVVSEAHGIVHNGVGGHGTMVAAMLDGEADPSATQACRSAIDGKHQSRSAARPATRLNRV